MNKQTIEFVLGSSDFIQAMIDNLNRRFPTDESVKKFTAFYNESEHRWDIFCTDYLLYMNDPQFKKIKDVYHKSAKSKSITLLFFYQYIMWAVKLVEQEIWGDQEVIVIK